MPTTHVLFDFFGTLVDYDAAHNVTDYTRTREVLAGLGLALSHEEFVSRWIHNWMEFETRGDIDHREFSMTEVGTGFLTDVLGRSPGDDEVDALVGVYVEEWNTGVRPIAGMAQWLGELAQRYRLAIVSNTHEPHLVRGHLDDMGIAGYFELVVLSIEVGWRKPHPKIYATALDGLGLSPEDAVFVGDNHFADFVGPSQVGIRAYLIDPHGIADVPAERRLGHVFEVAERLLG